MQIAVIGTGYVGLVAGVCLADSGNECICVDSDASKIQLLRAGRSPIYEPGLEELLERSCRELRLSFTTDLAAAVRASSVVFVAVGTPPAADGSVDLSAVMAVAREIARSCDGYRVIVIKSTVPVGTAEKVAEVVRSLTKQPFDVVSNPEFLKEGAAIEDFVKPDRVVVGTNSERAREVMRELYSPFVRTGAPILMMDSRSAELSKYASNCMLACRISMMNELAALADALGADVLKVRECVGFDRRIGQSFLFPGLGFGGSCLPKDVRALISMGRSAGVPVRMLEGAYEINEAQKLYFVPRILGHFGGKLGGRRIAMWGLAFKPRTDDIREAPALAIIEALLEKGARVAAYDPEAMENVRRALGGRIDLVAAPYDALKGAEALIVVTEWNEFRRPNWAKMKELMASPVVFDGRNIYDKEVMLREGFTYYGVGRGVR